MQKSCKTDFFLQLIQFNSEFHKQTKKSGWLRFFVGIHHRTFYILANGYFLLFFYFLNLNFQFFQKKIFMIFSSFLFKIFIFYFISFYFFIFFYFLLDSFNERSRRKAHLQALTGRVDRAVLPPDRRHGSRSTSGQSRPRQW